MKNANRVLNYYKQLINRKKLEISLKEKDITDTLYQGAHYLYYLDDLPPESNFEKFSTLYQELIELYFELFKLQGRYLDIKGKEGFIYVKEETTHMSK